MDWLNTEGPQQRTREVPLPTKFDRGGAEEERRFKTWPTGSSLTYTKGR
jgi:hypothetical protein